MKRTWFTCEASKKATAQADIAIYDEIGYWGINAQDFRDALQGLGEGVKQINLRINSPGGVVFEGIAIHNMLARHPARVIVTVDGIAASIASFVAMAGDEVQMPENSMMMIHNPAGVVMGTATDMRDVADALDKIQLSTAASYARKSGKTQEQVIQIMNAETWYTAQEALREGFADQVLPPSEVANRFDLGRFQHPPTSAKTAEEWVASGTKGLPIENSDTWDGAAAKERMLDDAGFNGNSPDPAQARRGFLTYDHNNPNLKGSYKLPFADIQGGELRAVAGGVRNAASRLPQTDGLSDDVQKAAKGVLDDYMARIRKMNGEEHNDMSDPNKGAAAPNAGATTTAAVTTAAQTTTTAAPVTPVAVAAASAAAVPPAAATVPDPVSEERDRCAQITAACEVAGHPARASDYIDKGASIATVLSELRGMPRRGQQASAAGEVSARNSGVTKADAQSGWERVVARKNGQVR